MSSGFWKYIIWNIEKKGTINSSKFSIETLKKS